MGEINKKFDGVSWEWKGKTAIRDLKPICPKCKYELDIKMTELDTKYGKPTEDGRVPITLTYPHMIYSCPKCTFSINTTIENVDSPSDLHKVVLKEFEHRQRLMLRKTSKNHK